MNNTPQSNRLHVGIFGETNAGKSSLFNALTGTDISIVSDLPGTTTDPVVKAMELLPFGPIVLMDTAGLGDESDLGRQRMEKTNKQLNRIDLALYLVDTTAESGKDEAVCDKYKEFKEQLAKKQIPHILVKTKADTDFEESGMAVSVHRQESIDKLKKAIADKLSNIKQDNGTLLGDLLPAGSTVLMVAPIDSEAPKGRLILPQSQLIRDCLDNGIMACVVTVSGIKQAISSLEKVDLVVTDSQVFGQVAELVPPEIRLTSFSILMARQKNGDISPLLEGIKAIENLKENDNVLISEVCTHNRTHEDIGRVKIPAAISKIAGCKLNFEFTTGRDFMEDLSKYALIIHCGACMITPTEMQRRITAAKQANVPITNYGLFLAHVSGVLSRSTEILGG